MCDIAPFCMECEWEDVKEKLIMCKANQLHAALREIPRSLPFIGDLIEPYRCEGFEIPHIQKEGDIYEVGGSN